MVSGRQSRSASRGPAQTDGDLGEPRKVDKGTQPRAIARREREGGRQEGKGKQRETQPDRQVRDGETQSMRGRDKIQRKGRKTRMDERERQKKA